jgi:hypothetical protein
MIYSMRNKSHTGYVMGGAFGTFLDFVEAVNECKIVTKKLDLYLEEKDLREGKI